MTAQTTPPHHHAQAGTITALRFAPTRWATRLAFMGVRSGHMHALPYPAVATIMAALALTAARSVVKQARLDLQPLPAPSGGGVSMRPCARILVFGQIAFATLYGANSPGQTSLPL